MTEVSLIFPNQLFKQQSCLSKTRPVYLIEEHLFFTQYRFHKQKLLLHRAGMKIYESLLLRNGYEVNYVEAISTLHDIRKLIPALAKKKVTTIHVPEINDDWLERRIRHGAGQFGINITFHPSSAFINGIAKANAYFDHHNYFQTDFYIHFRKKNNWLLDPGGKPAGGKWSFDANNRKKLPKGEKPPEATDAVKNTFTEEAFTYVSKHFKTNYGSMERFAYPVTYKAAQKHLRKFLEERFEKFGPYEDAIAREQHTIYHSMLSAAINIGLLDPREVIEQALAYATEHNIPLNSAEGLLRQISGWREYIRVVYLREGRKQRTGNFFGFRRKIPESFWKGTTGIDPVDQTISKVLKTGYCHHIERLMILGNFMLLCEFDPDEVYRWFMELFIDSYDWVMVPNVYGMVQFADGGLMTTKPYISGSNYILKMSDYKKGEWSDIWDALFWRFMIVHRDVFEDNARWKMLTRNIDKMDAEKRKNLLNRAEKFLVSLDE